MSATVVRDRAWLTAGGLLVALAVVVFLVGIANIAASPDGFAYVALALPPAGAGALVLRRVARVRISALSVSLAYAAFVGSVVTAPYSGLSEADGSNLPGPDAGLVVVGLAFVAAAVLLVLGHPERQVVTD